MKSYAEYIVESDEDKFRWALKTHSSDGVHIYHETPGHVAASIKKHGLKGEQGVHGTIGEPSGFVTSKKKTITHFVVPHNKAHQITHDMRYDSHADFLKQHPTAHGGDVCVNCEKIPHHWIRSVKEET